MKTVTTSVASLALLLGLALPAAAQQEQQPTAQQTQEQGQEMQAEATVATVDETSLMLTTEEGDEYTLAEGSLVQGLTSGTQVRITYTEQDGQKTVTNIEPVQQ